MRAAKGVAQIDEVALVGQVSCRKLDRPSLAKIFAQGPINRPIAGQVLRSIAIQKAGAVSKIAGDPAMPAHIGTKSNAEGVALIVIEKEGAFCRRAEVRKASGDGPHAFDRLVRIRQVEVRALKQSWRSQRALKSANANALDGQGKENVGVADNVVVEKVMSAGAEIVEV